MQSVMKNGKFLTFFIELQKILLPSVVCTQCLNFASGQISLFSTLLLFTKTKGRYLSISHAMFLCKQIQNPSPSILMGFIF